MRTLRWIALPLLAAFVACGAPSSFDGLTGGPPLDAGLEDEAAVPAELVPDDTLPAPRPVAPISVSWVGTARPRFRWALAEGIAGARVEVCRTRACDGDKRTFEAAGAELTVPEDLEPGFWFWRVYGKTAASVGTKPSATWELLVRGGPMTATSQAANGSIVDINGDGRADLVVTVEYEVGAQSFVDVVPLIATSADSTSFATDPDPNVPLRVLPLLGRETALAGGTDTDGDGFADIIVADKGSGSAREVIVAAGSAEGISNERVQVVPTPPLDELPGIYEAGDLDGDGRGDLVVTTRSAALAFFGTGRGFGPFQYLFQIISDVDGGVPPFSAPIAAGGAFDRNGDGLSDVALASPIDAPLFFVLGGANGMLGGFDPVIGTPPARGHAERFASGDFDGDGLTDTAFVTTEDGKPAVCVLRATEPEAAKLSCFVPPSAPTGFATSMIACDLEGDGRDEILLGGAAGGVEVLRANESGLVSEHITSEWSARITRIYPGRPGAAVWAATRPDGSSIAVFRGSTKVTTLAPPAGTTRFGQWIR